MGSGLWKSAAETPAREILLTFDGGAVLEIDVGEIRAGTGTEVPVALHNSTGQSLSITDFEITCECLTIKDVSQTIAPGAVVPAMLALDLSSRPDFAGDLAIGVIGSDAIGRRLFQLSVAAQVRKTSEGSEAELAAPMPIPMPTLTEREFAVEDQANVH